ncbi:MAG: TIM-barrel domain-containing protein [Mucilaginibacter sp.]|uniref:glycoside hydrolase family 31 protein n=1 Tax=Mucilaginibacter sp. TaxID=1882438 RepID=UPI0032653B85
MIRYKYIFLALCLIFIVKANAQTGIGAYKSGYKKQGNTLSFSNANADVRLEFCSPTMFRVRASWSRKFEADEHLMQENYTWPAVDYKVIDNKESYVIQTSGLVISILKSTFKINVSNTQGIMLSSEYIKGGGLHHKGDTISVTKDLTADEHFFGFGERMDVIDQRNKLLKLNVGRGKSRDNLLGAYNILEANYCPVPFFMSTKGYGIFLHNSHATEWDMGQSSPNAYSFKAVGGELDYYFIYGPDFPTILNSYTSITGKSPMLTRFGFGLHMGTYSGGVWGHEETTSDKYPVALIKCMREMGIPVDILWLDSTWRLFGEVGGKGATTFEWRETFKDPKGMFDSLYANHIKMVGLHIRPRFDNAKKLNLLTQAQQQGFTYPEKDSPGEFVNFFDQKAVDWWWNNGVMKVGSMGAKFLKTDEGSAFGALANESEKIGPSGPVVDNLHNVFPVAYAKAPFLKFQDLNGFRGMNQTREGYAGIQRYPYIFAGDWPSEWQYFAPVIKAGINIGLSGVSDWAHCMGGFEHPADPELYIRWTQFGFFSPVALVFGFDHPGYKEPWNYGDEALKNFKKYDLLRYQLVPYIYSNAFTAYQTGMPLMRSLVLNYQNDPEVYQIGDQYLFGNSMMVCPVTVKGAQTRTIYFPEGTWYDYWTGEKFSGKQYVHVLTPLDKLPIYIKAGAIIPMQPEMKYMDEKPVDQITLDIWPGKNSSFDLYEDDGLSLKYKNGDYSITHITTSQTTNGLAITIDKPKGKFVPSVHNYVLRIHGAKFENSVQEESAVTAKWRFDPANNVLTYNTVANNKKDIKVEIK